MDLKKLGKALLFPHIAIMILLVPIATVLLVGSMVFIGTESIIAYISYVPKASLDSAYNMLAKSVQMEKGQSEYIITQQFMKMSAQKYKANKATHGEQIIQDYLDASTYVVEVLDKYNERIDFYEKKYNYI